MNDPQDTKNIAEEVQLSKEDQVDLLASLLVEIICEELCSTNWNNATPY